MKKIAVLTWLFFSSLSIWAAGPKQKEREQKEGEQIPVETNQRCSTLTEEELRQQLAKYKDIGLNQSQAKELLLFVKEQSKIGELRPDIGKQFYGKLVNQSGCSGLPWKAGKDSKLTREDATKLGTFATQLRSTFGSSARSGNKVSSEVETAAAVPALMQVLQTEHTSLLIAKLCQIDSKEATIALAKRAVFDLSPENRERAVQSLADRSSKDYWPILLDGLRYPWPAAANHAADAIAELGLKDRVPDLVDLLKEPNPKLGTKNGKLVNREVVRLNHLTNCVVCHAPSSSESELARGLVPVPGEAPKPSYYQSRTGTFVRAEVTYLWQDFSVMQSVPNPDKWAKLQRYDYFVLTRPATEAEVSKYMKSTYSSRTDLNDKSKPSYLETYPQRDAVLFAIRKLMQTDAGDTYPQWIKFLEKSDDFGPIIRARNAAKNQEQQNQKEELLRKQEEDKQRKVELRQADIRVRYTAIKTLANSSKREAAKRSAKELIRLYPNTPEAKDAQRILDQILEME